MSVRKLSTAEYVVAGERRKEMIKRVIQDLVDSPLFPSGDEGLKITVRVRPRESPLVGIRATITLP